jgi:DNA-binding transcriptional LysR family regulator
MDLHQLLSQHIKQLEDELGCPLFLRVGKQVLITEVVFRKDLSRSEECRDGGARDERHETGRGAPGVGATTLTYRLPHVLGDYNRRFPDIELIVLTVTTNFCSTPSLRSISIWPL